MCLQTRKQRTPGHDYEKTRVETEILKISECIITLSGNRKWDVLYVKNTARQKWYGKYCSRRGNYTDRKSLFTTLIPRGRFVEIPWKRV